MKSTRRDFLKQATAGGVIALGATTPALLRRIEAAQKQVQAADKVLVVIQMAGGNDGLNTVIPYQDDLYYKARPAISIDKQNVLKLDDAIGLHPAMSGMRELFEQGHLAVIQGVGYPNPDRSHFRSMDIWQSARPEVEYTRDGWLGRSIEQFATETESPAFSIGGDKLPLSLVSTRINVPMIGSLKDYQLELSKQKTAAEHQTLLSLAASQKSEATEQDFIRRAMATTLSTASRINKVADGYRSQVAYPQSGLGQRLKATAQLLTADLGANIIFTSIDGFDTHSQQQNAHQSLLTEFSDAVNAFYKDLEEHALADRVLVVTFSEFGRRIAENGSLGTDHGTAGPMFAITKNLSTRIVGKHPSLTDLDGADLKSGDLKHHTDFRRVYASVLEKWLSLKSEPVLFGNYEPLDFLS